MVTIIQRIYDRFLRPYLPRKFGLYQDIPARSPKLLDANDYYPDYKQGLFDAIDDHVSDGATVELVGFGRGVSTIHLLRAGAEHVTAHEAAEEMLAVGRETLEINDVSLDRVETHHTLVGDAIDVFGDHSGATVVPPSELTDVDVLVLDCEGAEASILRDLGTWPETVIVETHPERGVPVAETREAIPADYEVESYEYEPGREEKVVLAAVRTR